MASKVTLVVALILIFLGVLSIIAGAVQYFLIKRGIKDAVINNEVISGPSSPSYSSWVNQTSGIQYLCYFWNLTNSQEVLQGMTPNYTNVGPYTYSRRSNKFDIEFLDNGNEVQYKEFGNYTYEPSLSAPDVDPENDQIINVNPAYWGVLEKAGGTEASLLIAGTATAFTTILNSATGNCLYCFLPYIAASSSPSILTTLVNSYAEQIVQYYSNNITTNQALDILWNSWVNETTPSVPVIPSWWPLSAGQSTPFSTYGIVTRTEIEKYVLNPLNYFSLTSMDTLSIKGWIVLYTNSSSSSTIEQLMAIHFPFPTTQLQYIISWRIGSYYTNGLVAALLQNYAAYGAIKYSDLGLLQFGLLNGTLQGTSFYDISSSLAGIPEFGIYQTRNHLGGVNLNVSQINLIFQVFTDPLQLGAWFTGLINPFASFPAQTQTNLLSFVKDDIMALYVSPIFVGKVIVTTTPYGNLFGRVDPLIESLLGPGNGNVSGVFTDYTMALEAPFPADIFTTGQNDSRDAYMRLTYNGSYFLNYYDPPQPVFGSDSLSWVGFDYLTTQTPPLLLFVTQIARQIQLIFLQDSQIKGIPTKEYVIDPNYYTLLESEIWNNPSNFLLNTQSIYGVPIIFSGAAFYQADPTITIDKLNGVVPNPTLHNVYFHFEPITGVAISAYAPLQGSLYVNSSVFNGPNSGIAADRYYPLYWIVRSKVISDSDAATLLNDVVNLLSSAESALVILIVLGSLMLASGTILLVLFVVSRIKSKSENSQEIEMK